MNILHTKFRLQILLFLCFCIGILTVKATPDTHGEGFRFTENKNQWASDVLFRANIPNGFLFLQESGFQYSFYDAETLRRFHHPEHKLVKQFGTQNRFARAENLAPIEDGKIRAHGIKVSFLGNNKKYSIQKEGMGVERKNYFLGNDVSAHAQNVRSFEKIIYDGIYDKIGFQFYTQDNHLKYEFLVAPEGNPDEIKLKYEHASGLFLRDGHLIIQTSINEFSEQKPYCYQIIDGKKKEIPSRFVLQNNILSYEFPEGYDKNHELIIDPTVVFATYSGAVSDNWGFTATYDEDGNTYTGGLIFGVDFPTTTGAFDVEFNGEVDIAIHKYNEDGTALLYGTYLGGSSPETPHSLIVDKDNRLIIMGATGSSDFPVTSGAFQNKFAGGPSLVTGFSIDFPNGADIYASVLSTDGSKLEASTYLGGSGVDGIMSKAESPLVFNYGDEARGDVGTDSDGNIYIVSSSHSTNFPTKNALQNTFGGQQDAIITKFSPDLKTMIWGTYYGGSSFDGGFSMSITEDSEVYITGSTFSQNLRTHATALNPRFQGVADGFLLRLGNDGQFKNATYLGTSSFDMSYLTDTDLDGNAYAFGLTVGTYPKQNSSLQNIGRGQFLHKLDPTLSRTIFSTRFGSEGASHFTVPNLSPTAFRVTDCGHIYLAGWGGATNQSFSAAAMGLENVSTDNLPTTSDAFRRTSDGSDFYIMILDNDADNILYGSYFGGVNSQENLGAQDHVDGGTSRFSKDGTIYHAVCACRSNPMSVTSGSWATKNLAASNEDIGGGDGGCNMYTFKLNINDLKAEFLPLNARGEITREGCNPLEIHLDNKSENADRYEWIIEGIGTSTETEPVVTFLEAGKYGVQLTAFNDDLCLSQTVTDTIRVLGSPYSVSPDVTICKGESVQIEAEGGETYFWKITNGMNSDNYRLAKPTVNPSSTTTYEVTITSSEGCRYDTTTTVTVIDNIDLAFQTTVQNSCETSPTVSFTNKSTGADEYFWDFGNGKTYEGENPPAVTYSETGKYIIELRASNLACESSDTVHIDVISKKVFPDFEFELIQLCDNYPTVKLTNKSENADEYFWDFGDGRTFEGENPPDFKYNQEDDFEITLTAKNSECEASETKTVTIYSELISDFIANIKISDDELICETEQVQLEASGGVRYEWSPTTGLSNSTIANPIATPTQTTDYTVTIYSPRGCGIDTMIRVEVSPEIDINFESNNSVECGKRADFNFSNFTTNAEDFKWTMGDGQTFENQNPPANFQYKKSGVYTVVLEASNKACAERKELEVTANNVMPPNVITPNGDGKNDVFDIGTRNGGWKVEIFDRWGKEVYQSDSYENTWGSDATNTMYFYRITSPENDSCTGWLQVIK